LHPDVPDKLPLSSAPTISQAKALNQQTILRQLRGNAAIG
jgi:hypothetical protein